jgi:hypothetical protein
VKIKSVNYKKNVLILSRGVGRISNAYNLKKIHIRWANPKNITVDLNILLPKFNINSI